MIRRNTGIGRLATWIGLALFFLGPLEQLVPEDCDGHIAATVVDGEKGFCPSGAVPGDHAPSSPHTCHDLHLHGAVLGEDSTTLAPLAIQVRQVFPLVIAELASSLSETLRPPIA